MKAINYFIVFPERENEEGRSLRKKADISSRYYWFPCEMTSEERVQIWVVPLIVRIARKVCLNQSEANQKHYPDLRSVVSVSQTSCRGATSVGVSKCRLFSQAKREISFDFILSESFTSETALAVSLSTGISKLYPPISLSMSIHFAIISMRDDPTMK